MLFNNKVKVYKTNDVLRNKFIELKRLTVIAIKLEVKGMS